MALKYQCQAKAIVTTMLPWKRSSRPSLSTIATQSLAVQRKAELIWRYTLHTRRQAELAIFHSHGSQTNHCRAVEYINGFYNPRRKHPAFGWKSPLAFDVWLLK